MVFVNVGNFQCEIVLTFATFNWQETGMRTWTYHTLDLSDEETHMRTSIMVLTSAEKKEPEERGRKAHSYQV